MYLTFIFKGTPSFIPLRVRGEMETKNREKYQEIVKFSVITYNNKEIYWLDILFRGFSSFHNPELFSSHLT